MALRATDVRAYTFRVSSMGSSSRYQRTGVHRGILEVLHPYGRGAKTIVRAIVRGIGLARSIYLANHPISAYLRIARMAAYY